MIIIATKNLHKLEEYKKIIPSDINIKCINDFDLRIDIDENGNTLLENAFIKANIVYNALLNKNLINKKDIVISDDTGIFINYLENGPGVFSARFLNPLPQIEKNRIIVDLLKEVKEINDRKAYFKTIIFLISDNVYKAFEGRVDGYISDKISGDHGFGYDSIFIPSQYINEKLTYADINEDKNKISHRYKATEKLLKYINERSER